jgi:hypothetical protein
MKNEDPKDRDEITEEELKEIIEQFKKQKGTKKISLSMSFLLHKSYAKHLMLSFCVNLILSAVVIGLSIGLGAPLMKLTVQGFFVGIILLTLTENAVKLLLFRYLFKVMIYSFGVLNIVVQILLLYMISQTFGKGFEFLGLHQLFIFSILFTGLRLMMSTYIRLWFSKEKVIFWR